MTPTINVAAGDIFSGFSGPINIHYQLSPNELTEQTISRGQGVLNSTGALCIHTGKFNGRSPQDKFIVKDAVTRDSIDWNKFNNPIDEKYFLRLRRKMLNYLGAKDELWVRDCSACADTAYRINIRVINETPWSNLFCYNMFLRPGASNPATFKADWQVIHAPGFVADPLKDGTRSPNFAVISFAHKTVLIGGTAYTGEIKKGIFTVLNFLLPHNHNVLSMHCSANTGKDGDVALFFGLSGTGKTTLSADPERNLIGDDEHGWDEKGVFNFEGGCYAKVTGLSKEKEPAIFNAVREGAVVENTCFFDHTNQIDYLNNSITENTRVSYPIHYILNAAEPSVGEVPQNIFFLTCDASGVLPAISKLTTEQAMFQFVSGYTAKIAGTETGITEPKVTFSACFGAPFLPLSPGYYANLLGKKMQQHKVNVWMVNTGWIGGPYGIGRRIPLVHTRAMINAALKGQLDNVAYETHPVFGMQIPRRCPGVPETLLNPRYTWRDRDAYDNAAYELAELFRKNFEQHKIEGLAEGIRKALPRKQMVH